MKTKEGDVIDVQFVRLRDGGYYWFEIPEGMAVESMNEEILRILWDMGAVHGPFDSKDTAEANAQEVLLGADCQVTDMGKFPPSGLVN